MSNTWNASANLPKGLQEYQAWRRQLADEAEQRLAEWRVIDKAEKEERAKTAPARRKAAARVRHANRRAAETRQTPSWADKEAIRAVYLEAVRLTQETGVQHHVDHVIPLRGRLVSGLHVHQNLQVIPWLDNLKKSNRHVPL